MKGIFGGGTGLLHIYCGDGKGKTTAGIGLCLRAAGYGYRVVVCQFMKDNGSSERRILEQIPGITLLAGPERETFSFRLTEEEREIRRTYWAQRLKEAFTVARDQDCEVLFLDEALYAVRAGLLDEELLVDELKKRPEKLEVILTGRDPGARLLEMADYVSEIKKVKHPFDLGLAAREGIER